MVRALSVAGALALAGLAHGQTWNAGSGNWDLPANWNPMVVPNSTSATAILGGSAAYTVSVGIIPTVGGLQITNAMAELDILNSRRLNVAGGVFASNGLIIINPAAGASNTSINF